MKGLKNRGDGEADTADKPEEEEEEVQAEAARTHLCYAQVRDFERPVCGQQQISWLNVFVNDSLAVQIFKAI